MKTIKQEDYSRLNKALYDLEDILSSMGVTEFTLSRDRHNMQIDINADNIDTEFLYAFCKDIETMHDAKFGPRFSA